MLFDSTYIFVLIGALISMLASMNVKSTYKKFSKVMSSKGYSAEQVADTILRNAGIYDVKIERVRGDLTDHYSPSEKVLRLSDTVYGSRSVAGIGVAAHECGHAIQHNEDYTPLRLRSVAVPVANIGSKASWPLILIGLLFGFMQLAQVGVLLFSLVVLVQLITLPVEFDASRRALNILGQSNILEEEELSGAQKVLKAAALTYVAALFSTILQLLRLVILTSGGGRKRD